jgi:DNA-directed RNA polymerase subunit RPC12/RpoP
MTPAFRVKFGLLTILAAFLAIFAWSAAQGQFRPPRSPRNPNPGSNPGMRPPGGMGMGGGNPAGGMGIGWSCPKCGRTGQGAIPPGNCPGCGVKFINGVGNGSAGGMSGIPGGGPPMNQPPANNPPGFNPAPPNATPPMNQPGMNQPGMNPGGVPNNGPMFENIWTCGKCGKELGRGLSAPPDRCPHCGAHIINGVGKGVSQPGMQGSVSTGDSSSGGTKSSKKWLIGVAIGVAILVGLGVLFGGTWLVVQMVRSSDPASRPRRRRRRLDYDD